MTARTRFHLWRRRRRTHRRVRALAATTSMVWMTETGPSLEPPVDVPRGRCHICAVGEFTVRDPFSGVRCCGHCGAPLDQIPGAIPRDGARASDDHVAGSCGCRSIGRYDLDARERERAYV